MSEATRGLCEVACRAGTLAVARNLHAEMDARPASMKDSFSPTIRMRDRESDLALELLAEKSGGEALRDLAEPH